MHGSVRLAACMLGAVVCQTDTGLSVYLFFHLCMTGCPPRHACLQRLPWRRVLRQLTVSQNDVSFAAVQSYYELEAEEYKRKVCLVGYFASCAGTAV